MGRRFETTLSTVEAAVLGIAHHVQVRRFPLTFPSLSAEPTRLIKIGLKVLEDLEARRLSSRGRLNADLQRCFELFAEHTISIGVSGVDNAGADFFILGLTDHRDQLVVTQHDDELDLRLDDGDDLPALVVPMFDYGWSAPSLTAHRMPLAAEDSYQGESGDAELSGPIQEMVRAPERGFESAVHRPSDGEMIAAIPGFERLGGGFIAMDGKTRSGGRVHAPPLSWIDTKVGRYLVTIDHDRLDTGEMVYTPCDAAQLRRTLHERARTLWTRVK